MRLVTCLLAMLLWTAPDRSKVRAVAPSDIKLKPECAATHDFAAESQLGEIINDEDQVMLDEVLMVNELSSLDDERVNKILEPHMKRQKEIAVDIIKRKQQYVGGSE